jgi:hypothetical protein
VGRELTRVDNDGSDVALATLDGDRDGGFERTYASPGTFTPTVTVADPTGTARQASATVEVRDRTEPAVALAPSDTELETGDALSVTAKATDDRSLSILRLPLLDGGTVEASRATDATGSRETTLALDASNLP